MAKYTINVLTMLRNLDTNFSMRNGAEYILLNKI